MSYVITKCILILSFAYVYVRLLIPYIGFFARYMFNEPTQWDKYIEKPRLVFQGVGLILMHTSYSGILEYSNNSLSFYFIGNCLIFIGGIAMSEITWSKRFKTVFIPKIKEKLKRKNNFNVSTTNDQLKDLYNGLVRYDMIIIDRTDREDFVSVFTKDWHTHESKIHFKLNAPSCREFYELFKVTFPKNSLSMINFFKRSNTIRRNDGKPYKYATVKDAKSRSPISKRSDDLKDIFANL